jgi:hypothetical protein
MKSETLLEIRPPAPTELHHSDWKDSDFVTGMFAEAGDPSNTMRE